MNERVADVQITEDTLSVRLMDGRSISVPLEWYPPPCPCQRQGPRRLGSCGGRLWHPLAGDRRGLEHRGLLRGAPAPRGAALKPTMTPPTIFWRCTSPISWSVRREVSQDWNLNIAYADGGSIVETVILDAKASGAWPIPQHAT